MILLLAVDARRGLFAAVGFPQGPPFLYVGLAFDGFFILQGILAQQGWGYAYPIGACVGLFFAIAVELACRMLAPALARVLLPQRGSDQAA